METVRAAPPSWWNRADYARLGDSVHADQDPAPLEEALHSRDFRLIAHAGQVYLFGVTSSAAPRP